MYGTDHMEPLAAHRDRHRLRQRAPAGGDACSIPRCRPISRRSRRSLQRSSSCPSSAASCARLQPLTLLPGVLSTRMWIKQRNRACETLLEKWAEPFSTWAQLAARSRRGGNERLD